MPNDTITEWAERHRVRVRKAEDGERIVPGKFGHVYQHAPGDLRALYLPPPPYRPRRWTSAKKRLQAAGCRVIQDLDGEGVVSVSSDPLQAGAVLAVFSIRRRKVGYGVSRPFGPPKAP